MQKCYLGKKSVVTFDYTEDRGLHVVAKKKLSRVNIEYFVRDHVSHIKEKVPGTNFYRMNFCQYKSDTNPSHESSKGQSSNPPWDGPLSFLTFACTKHCTFNMVQLHSIAS